MSKAYERVRRAVAFRCGSNLLLRASGAALAVAAGAALLAVAAERLTAVSVISRYSVAGLGAVALLAVAVAFWVGRPRPMQVALLIDDRLALRERFSTTLAFADSENPFAQAAARQTRQLAESIHLAGRFPVRLTARWAVAVVLVAATAAAWRWLPAYDLFRLAAARADQKQQDDQAKLAKAQVTEAASQVSATVQQLGDPKLAEELAKLAESPDALAPQDLRREAVRRLGDLSDKLKEMERAEPAAKADALRQMLKRLRGVEGETGRELSRALASGQLDKAAAMLRDLQAKLQEGKLSEQQKQDLARQLAELSKRLNDLAEGKQDLADALAEAGLDRSLADADREQLEKACQQAGLNKRQLAELLKKREACQNACKACQGLADEMGQFAGEGGQGDGQGQELSPDELADLIQQLEGLAGEQARLGQIEGGLEDIDKLIAMLGQGNCEGGEGQGLKLSGAGPFREGPALQQGGGSGGPGRGQGKRETADDPTAAVTEKTGVRNENKDGPVIASWLFKGEQVRGESKRDLTEAVQAAKDHAAEAVSDNRIPGKYGPSVKRYFDQMPAGGEADAPAPAAPPAEEN